MVKISILDIKKLKFFAICFKGTDKNIGKLDNLFSLSPTVMYLPSKLQDTILKKLIIIASVITIIESLTKLSWLINVEVINAAQITALGLINWNKTILIKVAGFFTSLFFEFFVVAILYAI